MQYQSECRNALESVVNISKSFQKVFMDAMKFEYLHKCQLRVWVNRHYRSFETDFHISFILVIVIIEYLILKRKHIAEVTRYARIY